MITSNDLEFARLVTVPALRARLVDERGATMVEYGLVLALVAVVAMVGFTFIGNSTKDNLMCTGSAMSADTLTGDIDGDPLTADAEYYDVDGSGGVTDGDIAVSDC